MPITLQYGANPTVAMMMAYAGGKNAYRNKQEEEYRRLYMQQQQLQQQAQLQREHMQSQYLLALGSMGFRADQQEEAIEARQGIMNQRLEVGEVENKNTWAMRKFGIDAANAMRLRIVREQIKARKKEGPPDDPGPEGLPSQKLDDIPRVNQPERTGFPKPRLAAHGLGGRPPATRQDRVTLAAQQRTNQRRIRMGYGMDFPKAARGYLDPSTITHTEPAPYTGKEAAEDWTLW